MMCLAFFFKYNGRSKPLQDSNPFVASDISPHRGITSPTISIFYENGRSKPLPYYMKFALSYLTHVPQVSPCGTFHSCEASISIAYAYFICRQANFIANNLRANYLLLSSIATATATVIPTIGLLPAPIRPIIST